MSEPTDSEREDIALGSAAAQSALSGPVEVTADYPAGSDLPPVEGLAADGLPGEESVLRASTLMGIGTVVSRISGVVRGAALAAAVGFGVLGNAFALGNTLPNIVYILVIGGASTPFSYRSSSAT